MRKSRPRKREYVEEYNTQTSLLNWKKDNPELWQRKDGSEVDLTKKNKPKVQLIPVKKT